MSSTLLHQFRDDVHGINGGLTANETNVLGEFQLPALVEMLVQFFNRRFDDLANFVLN